MVVGVRVQPSLCFPFRLLLGGGGVAMLCCLLTRNILIESKLATVAVVNVAPLTIPICPRTAVRTAGRPHGTIMREHHEGTSVKVLTEIEIQECVCVCRLLPQLLGLTGGRRSGSSSHVLNNDDVAFVLL